jgi:hypothetical protein
MSNCSCSKRSILGSEYGGGGGKRRGNGKFKN